MTAGAEALRALPAELAAGAPMAASLCSRSREARAHALYQRHARPVGRFLRDLLGDAADAADATQETFVRAFLRLHTLDDAERAAAWLFGIARNVCLEQRRHRRRHPRASSDDVPEVAADAPTPETTCLDREAARTVERVLARLSEDRRSALLLRVDHGLGYAEIAGVMGWTRAKAKIEVHRARLVLRGALDEPGADR